MRLSAGCQGPGAYNRASDRVLDKSKSSYGNVRKFKSPFTPVCDVKNLKRAFHQ